MTPSSRGETQSAARAILFTATFCGVGLSMADFDFAKAWNDALIKKAMNETSLESIASRLPPEGQVWLNGLNPFCRRTVEFDLRNAGLDEFVKHWKTLRDTLERLEREFGPSDDWK
jgi:hypothetical protein